MAISIEATGEEGSERRSSTPEYAGHHIHTALHPSSLGRIAPNAQNPHPATTQAPIQPLGHQAIRISIQSSYSNLNTDEASPPASTNRCLDHTLIPTSQIAPDSRELASCTNHFQETAERHSWSYEDYKRTRLTEWFWLTEGSRNSYGYDSDGA